MIAFGIAAAAALWHAYYALHGAHVLIHEPDNSDVWKLAATDLLLAIGLAFVAYTLIGADQ